MNTINNTHRIDTSPRKLFAGILGTGKISCADAQALRHASATHGGDLDRVTPKRRKARADGLFDAIGTRARHLPTHAHAAIIPETANQFVRLLAYRTC
ncbi:hypothetical protein [Burkholderia sp. SIMBA_062]|uniref:hypothetical protein n=1 Tax=Burkholderia sp. SIMBA_062 TaxID=3085803 RepID=UPI00397D05FE